MNDNNELRWFSPWPSTHGHAHTDLLRLKTGMRNYKYYAFVMTVPIPALFRVVGHKIERVFHEMSYLAFIRVLMPE